jgi:protein-S-isoprenylcysteine O-methyltransferase Ste14
MKSGGKSLTQKILPPTWLLISVLLMISLHFLLPFAWLISPVWNLLGILPIGAGIIINLAADREFHLQRTTVRPFDEPSALVTNGVFRFSRNPMYLGFDLILFGVAVLLRTLSPYFVLFAFTLLINSVYIPFEERSLAIKFGHIWESYRLRVRRWI